MNDSVKWNISSIWSWCRNWLTISCDYCWNIFNEFTYNVALPGFRGRVKLPDITNLMACQHILLHSRVFDKLEFKKNTKHITLIKNLTSTIIASKATKNHHFALVHAGRIQAKDKQALTMFTFLVRKVFQTYLTAATAAPPLPAIWAWGNLDVDLKKTKILIIVDGNFDISMIITNSIVAHYHYFLQCEVSGSKQWRSASRPLGGHPPNAYNCILVAIIMRVMMVFTRMMVKIMAYNDDINDVFFKNMLFKKLF